MEPLPTDGERLAVIEAGVSRLLKLMDDNGQPGMVTRLTRVEDKLEQLASASPAKVGAVTTAAGGAFGAIIAGIGVLAAQYFGIKV